MTTTETAGPTAFMEVGCDTETFRIAHKQLAPRMVVVTGATRDGQEFLAAAADGDRMRVFAESIFADDVISIWHNAAYDVAVVASAFPHLISAIFKALAQGRVRCTKFREKLLWLATTGSVDTILMPDGTETKADRTLKGLVKHYFGVDISEGKDRSDAWRMNFGVLVDSPSEQWPEEARKYAIEDSVWALRVHDAQEQQRARVIQERNFDPFVTQGFRVDIDCCLRIWSCIGAHVDPVRHAEIMAKVQEELKPEKLMLLYETGILRPAEPPRPYSNGARNHQPGCINHGKGKTCECPPMMTVGEDESVNTKVLKQFIQDLAKEFPDDVKIKMTEPSKKFPEGQISTDAEWLEDHKGVSPVLDEFAHRASLQKLLTTELPRLCFKDEHKKPTYPADIVHPLYDTLKETGRTSSYGSDEFPSLNIQNIASSFGDGLDPRSCIIAPPGWLLFSVDYSYMELVTLAQTCLNLFGFSRLAEIINKGFDPHAWLGSQLALRLEPEFRTHVLEPSGADPSNWEEVYWCFKGLEKCGKPEWEKVYKHWRTFAKPTGLGYPGGLGPRTFIKYAKATFKATVDLEMATALRDAWREALPEMPQYFEFINNQATDPFTDVRFETDATGKERRRDAYTYRSPLGMVRANCTYCACSNGMGLQTPSAEGALGAVTILTRRCFDPAWGSPLLGNVLPFGFIHDEFLGYVIDNERTSEYCDLIGQTMVEAFSIVAPDVKIQAQPVLMRRWDKDAKPVKDPQGRLIAWERK